MTWKALLAAPLAFVLLPAPTLASEGPDGSVLFRQRCQTCHSVNPGQNTPLGPNLAGVMGRKAAATAFNYSAALKNSKLVWDRASLDRFLASPPRLVPGTRMVVPVSDPEQRAAIVDFLSRAGR